MRRAESVGWVGAAGGDCGLEEEKEEEDAGRDAPQTAWGKMPQPLRPVNGLGRTRQPRRLANGLAQDAPATTRRARHGRKLSTLPPLVGSGEARKPDGIFLAGRLVAISGEIVTAENEGLRNWPEPFHLFWRVGCDLGVATRFHKLGWRDGGERWRLGPSGDRWRG